MRTIIAGSRGLFAPELVKQAVTSSGFEVTTVLSGTARGIDKAGEQWAAWNGIPVERFPADWSIHGRSAGYKRNVQMAEHADALIAIWDGESRGTGHMIDIARKKDLNVHVYEVGA